ncbi:hypothetical protein KBC79_06600 [Candidatus Woesebacteria bacterium]|nr:hypothetical protein [Candidatus Woesebacteria bacterium]
MLTALLQLPSTLGVSIENPLFFNDLLLSVFKLLFIACAFLYVFFAFIVIRQVSLMKDTVSTPFSAYLQFLSYVHFAVSLGVVLFYIIVL